MKNNKINKFKGIILLISALLLSLSLTFSVYAEEAKEPSENTESGEATEISPKTEAIGEVEESKNEIFVDNSGDYAQNIFEDIYNLLELNADKIFSILAFVGTIVVSVGYKSGLLPLLRDALSKLKNAIDGVKAEGELNKALTESKMAEISDKIAKIESTLEKGNKELSRIEWQFENYEELMDERESMRLILQGQIDMLYAIFMSSALPDYQKEEIGLRIKQMREELASCEKLVKE